MLNRKVLMKYKMKKIIKVYVKNSSLQNRVNLVLKNLTQKNKKNFLITYKIHQVLINLLLIELFRKIISKF